MKKALLTVLAVVICIQLAGCSGWAIRTLTSRKARVDQEISGNRGFISGKPISHPKEPAFVDRKVYQIEIEMPQLRPKMSLWQRIFKRKKEQAVSAEQNQPKKKQGQDKVIWGNRGYILGGPRQEHLEQAEPARKKDQTPDTSLIQGSIEKTAEARFYKVRKGDTLQKISQKFYGTTKRWPLLYKINKDKLKSADRVYPGEVLAIPHVGQFKK